MNNQQKTTQPMSLLEALYHRRSVRNFTPQKIDSDTINSLLDAAIHAPNAMHEEAWAFSIIQDKKLLNRLSDKVKELLVHGTDPIHPPGATHLKDSFNSPEFNVFYNAETLVVICGKPLGPFVIADCWLAAENLMLAAFAKGLGTCVIGLAVTALNTPEWKRELSIHDDMTVFAPIIVGMPAGETLPVSRKAPEILCWK
jgi:nitroreductase